MGTARLAAASPEARGDIRKGHGVLTAARGLGRRAEKSKEKPVTQVELEKRSQNRPGDSSKDDKVFGTELLQKVVAKARAGLGDGEGRNTECARKRDCSSASVHRGITRAVLGTATRCQGE